MKPTLEAIMATQPCCGYPRERLEELFAKHGPFDSWGALAKCARAECWTVPLGVVRRAAYGAATPEQRVRGVAHATHARVCAQIARWPEVGAEVRELRKRLLAWTGDAAEIRAIRDAARDGRGAARPSRRHRAARHAADSAYAAADCAGDAYYADACAYYAAGERADAEYAAFCAAAYERGDTYYAASADAAYTSAYYEAAWETLVFICRVLDGAE